MGNQRVNKNSAGFTLIEMTVAIFSFGLIIFGLIALISQVFTSSGKQTGLLADTDQARKLAFSIVSEFRNGLTASNGAYAIDTAGSQTLIFYANIDSDFSVEKIRYFVQNGALWKGVTEYNGTSYNPADEKTFKVQNNLANGAAAVFYYYDGSFEGGASQAALSQPVNVTQVKFVKLDIKIFNKAGVKNTNSYSVSASGSIRNLKTNLGD